MSLVNRMLSDLERRRGGTAQSVSAVDGLRATGTTRLRERFRPEVAVLLLLAGAVIGIALAEVLRAGDVTASQTMSSALAAAAATLPAPLKDAAQRPATAAPPADREQRSPELAGTAMLASPSLREPDAARAQILSNPESAVDGTQAADDQDSVTPVDTATWPAKVEPPTRPLFVGAHAESLAAVALPAAAVVEPVRQGGAGTRAAPVKRIAETDADPVDQAYTAARRLVHAGEIAAAIDALREFLGRYPKHANARLTLVRLLLAHQEQGLAMTLLEDGLTQVEAGRRPELADVLARLHLQRGDAEQALQVLYSAMADAAANVEYLALVAAIEQQLGRHARAIETYSRLLGIDSAPSVWWMGLGISYAATARDRAAMAAFETALENPSLDFKVKQYIAGELARLRTGPSG